MPKINLRRVLVPPIPCQDRGCNHFKKRDVVVCWVKPYRKRKKYFIVGVVYEDIDDTDRYITVKSRYQLFPADNNDPKSEYGDGHYVIFGRCRPELLRIEEYEYLKKHPDFLKSWLSCMDIKINKFNKKSFFEAMIETDLLK